MNKALTVLLLFSIIVFLSQCKDAQRKTAVQEVSYDQNIYEEGGQLLQTYCVACHNPDMDLKTRLAPPMVAVKDHYLDAYDSKDTFVRQFVKMVQEPTIAETKMPNAVKKFGLMPKMPLSDTQLEAIATYVYHTDMKNPKWLEHHYEQEQARFEQTWTEEEKAYLKTGQEYANQTQMVLAKNLKETIQSKGTLEALTFCSQEAIALTDSMQNVIKTQIKRVSDLHRNPDNAANLDELAYIFQSKKRLANQQPLQPRIQNIEGKMVGYYPIMTNDLCLQCHGQPEKDIQQATVDHLNDLYPNDKAIGYGVNELRGIWVVEMEE